MGYLELVLKCLRIHFHKKGAKGKLYFVRNTLKSFCTGNGILNVKYSGVL